MYFLSTTRKKISPSASGAGPAPFTVAESGLTEQDMAQVCGQMRSYTPGSRADDVRCGLLVRGDDGPRKPVTPPLPPARRRGPQFDQQPATQVPGAPCRRAQAHLFESGVPPEGRRRHGPPGAAGASPTEAPW